MKILAIRGRNLASLAGDFAVEVESGALAEAGLFAITGPTGAGKSTLLDALCLALFDSTPRLHGRARVMIGRAEEEMVAANDPRSLMTRGAAEARAEVDFVGRDGHRYRSEWSVRRARGKVNGKLQDVELRLRDLDSGQTLGGKKSETLAVIEERLGLTFEQFLRSALLAQGEFAAFLKARAEERAELLERITGTEIYATVSMLAHQRAAHEKEELARLTSQIEVVSPLATDERLLLEAEAAAATAGWEAAKVRQRAAEARVAAVRVRDESAAEAARAVEAARAAADRARILGEGLDVTLRARDAAVAAETALHPELERARAGDANVQAATGRAADGNRVAGEAERALVEARGSWRKAKDEAAKRVAEAEASWRKWTDAVPTSEQTLRAAGERLAAARLSGDELEAAVQTAEQAVERHPAATVREEREAIVLRRRKLAELAATATEAERLVRAGADAAARARGAAADGEVELGIVTTALAERREAAAALAGFERALAKATERASLADRRAALVGGEACPLCGATEHPYRHQGAVVAGLISDLEREVEELKHRVDQSGQLAAAGAARGQELQRAASSARAEEAAAVAGLAEVRARWDLGARELRLVVAPGAEGSRLLAGLDAAAAARLEEVGRTERLGEQLSRAALEARRKRDTKRREIDRIFELASGAERELERARAEQASALAALERARQAPDPDARGAVVAEREAAVERARSELAARIAERDELVAARAKLLGGRATEEVADHGRRLVRESAAAAELARKGADQAALAASAAAAHAEAANVQLARRRAEALELGAVDAVSAAGELESAANAEKGAAAAAHVSSGRLHADDELIRRAAELAPLIDEQRAMSERWQVMSDLIGSHDGKKLRVYAQSLTLEALIAHANERLALLARRYRLMRVPEHAMDLQVVDLDMGHEVRSVNSLSGGESFLVSLALALALSALAARDTRVETLFIDEGLGTLDPATLDAALETLDALQATGRKIGLISHVPGLAERVGVQVRIEPRGQGRSRVVVEGSMGLLRPRATSQTRLPWVA